MANRKKKISLRVFTGTHHDISNSPSLPCHSTSIQLSKEIGPWRSLLGSSTPPSPPSLCSALTEHSFLTIFSVCVGGGAAVLVSAPWCQELVFMPRAGPSGQLAQVLRHKKTVIRSYSYRALQMEKAASSGDGPAGLHPLIRSPLVTRSK